MKNEVWKTVKDYEGFYEVSNKGRVRSVQRLDARGQRRKSKIMIGIDHERLVVERLHL